RRGDAKAKKNARAARRRRARRVINKGDPCPESGRGNASPYAAAEASARRFNSRASSGGDRKIRHRGGPGLRAAAVAAAAPIRFLAVESSSQLPVSNKLGDRSDPARAGETAPLAIYCRAQQRHPAGQRARFRLLSSARSPDAERSC